MTNDIKHKIREILDFWSWKRHRRVHPWLLHCVFHGLSEAGAVGGLRNMPSRWGSALPTQKGLLLPGFLNIEFPCDIILEKRYLCLKKV